MMEHWNTIAVRRMAGGPIAPTMEGYIADETRGHLWADGFEAGMVLRDKAWEPLFENRRMAETVLSVLDLTFDVTDQTAKPVSTLRRKQILNQLPTLLQRISDYWKNPLPALSVQKPIRSTKVGRNDPCPCGSAKKYKQYCGGAETVHGRQHQNHRCS